MRLLKTCFLTKNVLLSGFKVKRNSSTFSAEHEKYLSNLFNGLVNNNRADLAKSITLIETTHPFKKVLAQEYLNRVLKHLKEKKNKDKVCLRVGKGGIYLFYFRVFDEFNFLFCFKGITGPPGAGEFKNG